MPFTSSLPWICLWWRKWWEVLNNYQVVQRACIFRDTLMCNKIVVVPGYWSKRGLPSLASTKRPPSPLEMRRSLSRYVIRSQDLVRSPGMGILRGGWPEIARAIPAKASCRGLRDCWTGDKLIFWPKRFTFSGRLTLDLISGGCKVPSLNSTWIFISHYEFEIEHARYLHTAEFYNYHQVP